MKVSKATNEEMDPLRNHSKYAKVFKAIDNEVHGEYVKISNLSSGKECVTLERYLRKCYYLQAIRLSIKINAANKTIYVAKKIENMV